MHRPLRTAFLALVLFATQGAAARAGGADWLIPPVDGLVVRGFEQPSSLYGPGHRGIDLQVPAGTAVRAAGAGTVTFAGPVAGVLAITILHPQGMETTYSDLSRVLVRPGDTVEQGRWIGRSGESHEGDEGLHFGVKVGGTYVDPVGSFGPVDAGSAVHLVPLGDSLHESEGGERCVAGADLTGIPKPPNGNIAVAIAGIGSKTEGGVSADMYEQGPRFLGYRSKRIFNFSYRGTSGPRLHQPYATTDTFGDLRVAAQGLRDLLVEIAHRHPGVPVDLIAHSQGGIVARAMLELGAKAWDEGLPRIEHLVTFATPHQGVPAAAAIEDLRDGTASGRYVLGAASRWSRSGAPIPDPNSVAAAELAPGSDLMSDLGERDVLWGTQVLALGIPNDVVVPADRAAWPGKLSRVVPPGGGLWGHGAIVSSPAARGLAYDFLRDRPQPCPTGWDTWGPRVGRVIGLEERLLPGFYGGAELATGLSALPYGVRAARALGSGIRWLGTGLSGGW